MAVTPARRVLHKETAAAIKFLVHEENYPAKMLTTAWFLKQVHRWFELMTSRHPVLALSFKNKEVYCETIKCLNDVINLFKSLKFEDKVWKPIQAGVILSTTSILQLQNIFLHEKQYEFLLTSRFTQDCVENLFSTLRMKQAKPSALEVKRHLKIVTVSQYMKPTVSTSNYEQDDRKFLGEFFDPIEKKKQEETEGESQELEELKKLISNNVIQVGLGKGETNSLYTLAGYIARGVIRNQKVCEDCIGQILRDNEDMKNKKSYDALLRLKEYKEGALTPVNDYCFQMFEKLEQNFRAAEMVFPEAENLKKLVYDTSNVEVKNFRFSKCHNIKDKLVRRFITCRLRMYAEFHAKKKDKIDYGSKSVTLRALKTLFGRNKQKRKKQEVCRKQQIGQKKRANVKEQVNPKKPVRQKKQVNPKKPVSQKKQVNPKNSISQRKQVCPKKQSDPKNIQVIVQ